MDMQTRVNIAQEIGAIRGILNDRSVIEHVSDEMRELSEVFEASRVSKKRLLDALEKLEGHLLFVHDVNSAALTQHFWIARAYLRG